MIADLRDFLLALKEEGLLKKFIKEVNPEVEAAALCRLEKGGPTLFENVKGSKFSLAMGMFGAAKSIDVALNIKGEKEQRLLEFAQKRSQKVDPVSVESGPVRENVLTGEDVDLYKLPFPILHNNDGGPYSSAGILVAYDPDYGYNLSLHRLQLKGKAKMGIFMSSMTHLQSYYQRAKQKGVPLEVAVIIGCDPALYVASQITGSIDMDEYKTAGALRGNPIELVNCQTVNLQVPARAEIVLEGRVLTDVLEEEGPFGEFTGYYGPKLKNPVLEITGIMHRNDAIFQSIYEGKPPHEGAYLTALPKAYDIYEVLKTVLISEIRDIWFTPGGCGRYNVVVSIKKRAEGDPKLALSTILGSRIGIKLAIVVDEDIDIRNPLEVEWAVATRSQLDKDSMLITDSPVVLDPSCEVKKGRQLSAKMGIDATWPLGVWVPEVSEAYL